MLQSKLINKTQDKIKTNAVETKAMILLANKLRKGIKVIQKRLNKRIKKIDVKSICERVKNVKDKL